MRAMPLPRADAKMEMSRPNGKFEIRSSKLETITKFSRRNVSNSLALPRSRFDHFYHSLIRICFGFRYSNFELSGMGSFTLIELLVVIVIIALLMGLAFPVFQGAEQPVVCVDWEGAAVFSAWAFMYANSASSSLPGFCRM